MLPVAKVSLRRLLPADLAVFFDMQQDKDAIHMAAFTAQNPEDKTAFEDKWHRILTDPDIKLRTILVSNETGEQSVAGNVVVFPSELGREIGFWIIKQFWRCGVGQQAVSLFLNELKEPTLYARSAFDNSASIKILEANHFVYQSSETNYACGRDSDVKEHIYKRCS
jgi:RimJ/RimL family protein N-acetyltransferase